MELKKNLQCDAVMDPIITKSSNLWTDREIKRAKQHMADCESCRSMWQTALDLESALSPEHSALPKPAPETLANSLAYLKQNSEKSVSSLNGLWIKLKEISTVKIPVYQAGFAVMFMLAAMVSIQKHAMVSENPASSQGMTLTDTVSVRDSVYVNPAQGSDSSKMEKNLPEDTLVFNYLSRPLKVQAMDSVKSFRL